MCLCSGAMVEVSTTSEIVQVAVCVCQVFSDHDSGSWYLLAAYVITELPYAFLVEENGVVFVPLCQCIGGLTVHYLQTSPLAITISSHWPSSRNHSVVMCSRECWPSWIELYGTAVRIARRMDIGLSQLSTGYIQLQARDKPFYIFPDTASMTVLQSCLVKGYGMQWRIPMIIVIIVMFVQVDNSLFQFSVDGVHLQNMVDQLSIFPTIASLVTLQSFFVTGCCMQWGTPWLSFTYHTIVHGNGTSSSTWNCADQVLTIFGKTSDGITMNKLLCSAQSVLFRHKKRARLGLVQYMNQELLQPYTVLPEQSGDLVAAKQGISVGQDYDRYCISSSRFYFKSTIVDAQWPNHGALVVPNQLGSMVILNWTALHGNFIANPLVLHSREMLSFYQGRVQWKPPWWSLLCNAKLEYWPSHICRPVTMEIMMEDIFLNVRILRCNLSPARLLWRAASQLRSHNCAMLIYALYFAYEIVQSPSTINSKVQLLQISISLDQWPPFSRYLLKGINGWECNSNSGAEDTTVSNCKGKFDVPDKLTFIILLLVLSIWPLSGRPWEEMMSPGWGRQCQSKLQVLHVNSKISIEANQIVSFYPFCSSGLFPIAYCSSTDDCFLQWPQVKVQSDCPILFVSTSILIRQKWTHRRKIKIKFDNNMHWSIQLHFMAASQAQPDSYTTIILQIYGGYSLMRNIIVPGSNSTLGSCDEYGSIPLVCTSELGRPTRGLLLLSIIWQYQKKLQWSHPDALLLANNMSLHGVMNWAKCSIRCVCLSMVGVIDKTKDRGAWWKITFYNLKLDDP